MKNLPKTEKEIRKFLERTIDWKKAAIAYHELDCVCRLCYDELYEDDKKLHYNLWILKITFKDDEQKEALENKYRKVFWELMEFKYLKRVKVVYR